MALCITKGYEETPEKTESEGLVCEVPIIKHQGGTYEVTCSINELPLKLIFDTGASDVTISSVEANFMLKNGYLKESDIKGKKYYQVASGEIQTGTTITIREIKIGDSVLKNVDAFLLFFPCYMDNKSFRNPYHSRAKTDKKRSFSPTVMSNYYTHSISLPAPISK